MNKFKDEYGKFRVWVVFDDDFGPALYEKCSTREEAEEVYNSIPDTNKWIEEI